MKYTRPRGTEDWFLDQSQNFRTLTDTLTLIAQLFGYSEVKTPIFEASELFIRSVGATSDIVQKEFYNFKDKGDREMVLRPEGTAGVIRCVVEEKLIEKSPAPLKLFYTGPMFRYERPQNGRLRQFHQFGVECININSIYDDIDVLNLALSIINGLGLKNYELVINNIGGFAERNSWIKALQTYFSQHLGELTELSQSRVNTNPLRILDDKVDGIKPFVKQAPKIEQYLSPEEKTAFKRLTSTLDQLEIKYRIDPTLVRGLDYYTNFIFEINSTDQQLAGQPTLIGGGRYSSLVKELGGVDCNCTGFALGIERLLIALQYEKIDLDNKKTVDVVIANLDEDTVCTSLMLLTALRQSGISACCKFDAYKLPKHFSYAENLKAKFVIILGKKELSEKNVVIKNQKTLKQEVISIDKLVTYIKENKRGF